MVAMTEMSVLPWDLGGGTVPTLFGVIVPDPDVLWRLSLWSSQPCPLEANTNIDVFNHLGRIPLRIG